MAAAFMHDFLLAFALILPMGPQNSFILTCGANPGPWTRVLPVVVASMSDTNSHRHGHYRIALAGRRCGRCKVVGFDGRRGVFLVWVGVHSWRDVPGTGSGDSRAASAFGCDIRYALAVSWLNRAAVPRMYRAAVNRAAYAMAAILVSWLWFSGLSPRGCGSGFTGFRHPSCGEWRFFMFFQSARGSLEVETPGDPALIVLLLRLPRKTAPAAKSGDSPAIAGRLHHPSRAGNGLGGG